MEKNEGKTKMKSKKKDEKRDRKLFSRNLSKTDKRKIKELGKYTNKELIKMYGTNQNTLNKRFHDYRKYVKNAIKDIHLIIGYWKEKRSNHLEMLFKKHDICIDLVVAMLSFNRGDDKLKLEMVEIINQVWKLERGSITDDTDPIEVRVNPSYLVKREGLEPGALLYNYFQDRHAVTM